MGKEKTVIMPYEQVYFKGNTLSIEVDEAKRLLLFTGHKDKLAGHNEFQLDPRFKDGFGPAINDLAMPFDNGVGTLRITNPVTDNIWLTRIDGSGKSKIMPSGYLQTNGMMAVDKTNKMITIQDFVVQNDQTSNSAIVIDSCTATTGWSCAYGSNSTITVNNGIKITGDVDASAYVLALSKTFSIDVSSLYFITTELTASFTGYFYIKFIMGSGYISAKLPITANVKTRYVIPFRAPVGYSGIDRHDAAAAYTTLTEVNIGATATSALTGQSVTVHSLNLDVGKWVSVECNVNDSMIGFGNDCRFNGFTWNGSAYRGSYYFGQYATDLKLDANDGYGDYLDGSIAQNVYSTGTIFTALSAGVYPKGKSGDSVVKGPYFGATLPSPYIYSNNPYGTKYKIAFAMLLPPSDGRTGNSKMRFKLQWYYDDENEQKVIDLASGKQCRQFGIVRTYDNYITLPGTPYNYVSVPVDSDFHNVSQFMFMADLNLTNISGAYQGLWFDNARGAENRILIGGNAGMSYILFQGSTSTTSGISVVKSNAFSYGTRTKIAITYDGSTLKYWVNGTVINSAAMTGTLSTVLGKTGWIGQGYSNAYAMNAKLYSFGYTNQYDESVLTSYFQGYNVASQVKLFLNPKAVNSGKTTYTFSGDSQLGTGIQLMQKPYVCFADVPDKNVLKDLSGQTVDGTIYGTSIKNDSIAFDGVDDYIVFPTHTNLNIVNGNSVSVKFKIHQMPSDVSFLISTQPASVGSWGISPGLSYTNQPMCIHVGYSTNRYGIELNNVELDKWYRLTATYGNDGVIKAYLDKVDSTVYTGDYWSAGGTFQVSGRDGPYRLFNGEVAEVLKYNRVLSQEDVSNICDGKVPTNELVAYYNPSKIGKTVSYYVFTKKPIGAQYTFDENGKIINVTFTLDDNTQVYKGKFSHAHTMYDSDNDLIPNFVDSSESVSVERLIGHLDFIYDYVTKVETSPSIQTNDYSLTTSNCPVIYSKPASEPVLYSGNRLSPVRVSQTSSGTVNHYDISGKSTIRVYPDKTSVAGDCKIFDTVTVGNLTESTWKMIYDVNHAFTGNCVIENGLIRIVFSGNPYITVYYYNGSTWVSDRTMQGLVAGSDNCSICSVTINSISTDNVSVKTTVSGYTEYPTSLHNLNVDLGRGSCLAKFVLLAEGVFPNAPRYYDQRSNICRFLINNTIHDTKFFTADTSYFLNTCSGIGVSLDPTKTAIRLFCEPDGKVTDGFRYRHYSSTAAFAYTYVPTNMMPYTFYLGSIPYDCSWLYKEGESFELWSAGGTAGYGVTNDASGYPTSGNNVAWMLGTGARMSASYAVDKLAGKRFMVYVRAKGSRVLTDSLALCVDTSAGGQWTSTAAIRTATLQTSFSTFAFDITFPQSTSEVPIENFAISLLPTNADDLTVTVDYMLLVPIEDIEWHAKRSFVNLNETLSIEKI